MPSLLSTNLKLCSAGNSTRNDRHAAGWPPRFSRTEIQFSLSRSFGVVQFEATRVGARKEGTGQLWRIDKDGTVTRLAEKMGTTNGIDVSPDGKTLYVNESVQRNVWAFTIAPDRTLRDKRLLRKFDDHGFDGMRCDVDGNLYITRYGKGTVAKVSPSGEVLREVDVLGASPSNICFGGPDGRTAYVTEVKQRRLVQFRVDKPGLEWQRMQRK